ncbi:MAG TPA: hypothetical protein PLU50_11175 [Pseudobdellovibrionaceae bacterium]|nr:hypothetical protein [Pseudobdellovibrionaceae bacterium]
MNKILSMLILFSSVIASADAGIMLTYHGPTVTVSGNTQVVYLTEAGVQTQIDYTKPYCLVNVPKDPNGAAKTVFKEGEQIEVQIRWKDKSYTYVTVGQTPQVISGMACSFAQKPLSVTEVLQVLRGTFKCPPGHSI